MILVTGGAGFIGSAYVHYLNLSHEFNILIVDRLHDTNKWLNLRGLRFEKIISPEDLLTHMKNRDDEQLKDITSIVHLGACSNTKEMNMDYLLKNNVNFSQAVWNFACEKNIPFIYASSAATYGGGEHGYVDDSKTIRKLKPLNPYGYSKQLFDMWVLNQVEHDKPTPPHFFGLKFFNVFGPNEYHKNDMASIIYHAYLQIQATGKLKLFRSHKRNIKHGQQQRDFVYVKDVCQMMDSLRLNALYNALNASKERNGIYNIGSGKAASFLEVASLVFNKLNRNRRIIWIDIPQVLRDKYQYFTEANMSKTQQLIKIASIGLQPQINTFTLEDAVNEYINYLQSDNPYLTL